MQSGKFDFPAIYPSILAQTGVLRYFRENAPPYSSLAVRTLSRMDVPATLNNPNVPTVLEDAEVASVRQKLLDRINVSGIVPTAVANGMLVVGMNVDPVLDCHFGLTYYLVVAGTLSLSMVILNAINR